MSTIVNEKIKAYLAFLNILQKLKNSDHQLNPDFLEYIIDIYAPLSYMDTHYYLSKEIREYELDNPKTHTFEGDQEITHSFKEAVTLEIGNNKHTTFHSLPLTFIGNVHVKGNLEIPFDSKLIIQGDLIVDRVLTCNSDVRLLVGGTISAKGIEVDSSIDEWAICAEKIEVSDVIYTQSFIYAGKIQSRLIVTEGAYCCFDLYHHQTKEKQVKANIQSSHILSFPIKDNALLKDMFKKEVFEYVNDNPDAYTLLRKIFEALKDELWAFDENDNFILIDNIFKS